MRKKARPSRKKKIKILRTMTATMPRKNLAAVNVAGVNLVE
jgi:hypothetical protein